MSKSAFFIGTETRSNMAASMRCRAVIAIFSFSIRFRSCARPRCNCWSEARSLRGELGGAGQRKPSRSGREYRRLGGNARGNAPEDHCSGLLDGFQALAQETGVSVPKLDVVLGCRSVLKSDRLANHEGHGFGLGLADLFGGQGAAVATVQHFVSDLMHEGGKLLGWLHPSKQRDLPAMRKTLRGSNSLGEAKLDTLRFHELEQPFAVSAHVAVDFGQRGKVFAVSLADILSRDLRPSLCAPDGSRQ